MAHLAQAPRIQRSVYRFHHLSPQARLCFYSQMVGSMIVCSHAPYVQQCRIDVIILVSGALTSWLIAPSSSISNGGAMYDGLPRPVIKSSASSSPSIASRMTICSSYLSPCSLAFPVWYLRSWFAHDPTICM